MRDLDGAPVSIAELRPGEVYVTGRSQTKFGARAGDDITIYAGGNAVERPSGRSCDTTEPAAKAQQCSCRWRVRRSCSLSLIGSITS